MNFRGGGASYNSLSVRESSIKLSNAIQIDKPPKILVKKEQGFTLAEVLITLGVIGIIAAMTLPSLIANHRKQVTLTKVKQTYNILNNALERAKLDYDTNVNNWYIPQNLSQLEKSMFFAETYLIPYLKVDYYCKDKYTSPYCKNTPKRLNSIDLAWTMGPGSNKGTSFLLNNGTVVYIANPTGADSMRVWIMFDIDGPKGFNKLGYDVFMVELSGAEGLSKNNPNRNKFLPYGYDTSKKCDYYVSADVNHACNPNSTYSGSMCLAYIVCNGWDFGDKYPW